MNQLRLHNSKFSSRRPSPHQPGSTKLLLSRLRAKGICPKS
jgi:hypothetical protein